MNPGEQLVEGGGERFLIGGNAQHEIQKLLIEYAFDHIDTEEMQEWYEASDDKFTKMLIHKIDITQELQKVLQKLAEKYNFTFKTLPEGIKKIKKHIPNRPVDGITFTEFPENNIVYPKKDNIGKKTLKNKKQFIVDRLQAHLEYLVSLERYYNAYVLALYAAM